MNSRQRRKIEALQHNERRDLMASYYNVVARVRIRFPMVVIRRLINPSTAQIKLQISELESILIE